MATASEPSCSSASRSFLPSFTRSERVADRDADADQALELVGDPAEVRGAAGDHDLADAQRAGLVLVELERGDELAREGLELAPNRFASAIRLLLGEPLGHVRGGERELALERLGLGRRAVELAGDRDVERRAAPVEHARELADAAVGDGEGRAVVADRDDDERRVGGRRVRRQRVAERAQQRERLEVDAGEPHAGLLAGGDVAVDQLAVGDDEQDRRTSWPSSSVRSPRTW